MISAALRLAPHRILGLSKTRIRSYSSDVRADDRALLTEKTGKVFRITLNRPDKFNAMTLSMYAQYVEALREASDDLTTSVTVVTGKGDYYSTGNDLSNFAMMKTADGTAKAERLLREFVNEYINHRKPVIALVNGPAIGIAATLLGLSDLAIASDKATFHTPFTTLGQSPEACSSYTFPLLMGTSKANEVLLFAKKLNAEEALQRNLIAEVIPHNKFVEESERRVAEIAKLPPESLQLNKQLIRSVHKQRLLEVNAAECDLIKRRWLSDECLTAVNAFLARKK